MFWLRRPAGRRPARPRRAGGRAACCRALLLLCVLVVLPVAIATIASHISRRADSLDAHSPTRHSHPPLPSVRLAHASGSNFGDSVRRRGTYPAPSIATVSPAERSPLSCFGIGGDGVGAAPSTALSIACVLMTGGCTK